MNPKEPLTLQGKLELEKELETLIKVDREEIKKSISEARELGDLKENAEYHSAKEKQALIEGQIGQLQGVLANSETIDVTKISADKVVFGATVTLYDPEKDKTHVYKVVGAQEADLSKGKISYKGPLGKALLQKEEGDEVVVKAPKGDVIYEIESFEYK
jgi:transcription elongation factor GreA